MKQRIADKKVKQLISLASSDLQDKPDVVQRMYCRSYAKKGSNKQKLSDGLEKWLNKNSLDLK